MHQVDSRVIDYGTATIVVLYIEDEGLSVVIEGPAGVVPVYVGSDGTEALDAFAHPFARHDVPNIWDLKDAPERELAAV